MAHKKEDGAGGHLYYYYITDGAGRQLAVGEDIGEDVANPHIDDDSDPNGSRNMPYMAGAQFAGGIHSSFGFTPERYPTGDLPGIAFFRNRWYDQATSRWLSEDPIGLAGGVNLYQYVGNNPASYTDPFGLCPPEDDNYDDCAPTSPHYWANRGAQGEGSSILNNVAGVAATIAENLTADQCPDCTKGLVPDITPGAGAAKSAGLVRGIARTIRKAQGASVSFTKLGKHTRAVWKVAGDKGAGHVRWTRILDDSGNTVRLHKDVYDQGGRYLRSDFYVGPRQ